MALTAAVATAIAAVCASLALGGAGGGPLVLAPVMFALALLPGVVLAGARPDRRTPATGEMRVVIIATAAVMLLLYVNRSVSLASLGPIARLLLLAVVPLSLLWPAPIIVRYCLLISVGTLMAAGSSFGAAPAPVAGIAAGAAVALVALNRLSATSVATLASVASTRPRRMAAEAALLLAIAGLVGLLVGALLPPRDIRGGDAQPGDEPDEGVQPAPYLNELGQLDPAGPGSGKGDQVLLRIRAPGPALWRTQTFDRWNGRTWGRSLPSGPAPDGAVLFGPTVLVPPGIGDQDSPGDAFVHRVRVEAGRAGVLVGAPRAVAVNVPPGRGVRVSADGAVRPQPPLGRGASYVVISSRSNPQPEELRAVDPSPGGIPDEVARLYLQLPPIPPPVRNLAAEVTASAPTAYDKATAVEEWIFSNTAVETRTERLSQGQDPIERFLLVDRKGSPEQAAGSMAVMLRSLGIPARVAVGFLPGDRYALGGEFVVRQRHAHAWVEAWFPQFGWVPFDPSGRGAEVQRDDSFLDRLRRLVGAFWWVLALALAVLVRWLTRRWLRRWLRRRARPWVTRCYERLVRAGHRQGRPRRPHETPVEYCAALARETADERLVEVGSVISAAAYSNREPAPEARAWVDQVVREIERQGRHRRERRLEKSGRR